MADATGRGGYPPPDAGFEVTKTTQESDSARAGTVLAPVKLWCDTSTGAECAVVMHAAGGEPACIAEAGNPVLPGYTASKLRWFRDTHPDLYARMIAPTLLPGGKSHPYGFGLAADEVRGRKAIRHGGGIFPARAQRLPGGIGFVAGQHVGRQRAEQIERLVEVDVATAL